MPFQPQPVTRLRKCLSRHFKTDLPVLAIGAELRAFYAWAQKQPVHHHVCFTTEPPVRTDAPCGKAGAGIAPQANSPNKVNCVIARIADTKSIHKNSCRGWQARTSR